MSPVAMIVTNHAPFGMAPEHAVGPAAVGQICVDAGFAGLPEIVTLPMTKITAP
jgi:hypothetical protein